MIKLNKTLYRDFILNFDELAAKVDDVLNSIFTERCAFSVWLYFETKFSVERLDVARKPKAFSDGLRSLFGEAAQGLEELILKTCVKYWV